MPAASSPAALSSISEEFQLKLHRSMKAAGFSRWRARCQTSLGRLSECVAAQLTDEAEYEWMMTGSYIEGWGNHLFRLDGVTGRDSDIDWSEVVRHKVYHLADTCHSVVDCIFRTEYTLQDGHISVKNCSRQPAFETHRRGLRPAADECHAYPCCSYPQARRDGSGDSEDFVRHVLLPEFDNARPRDDMHFVRASVPGKQNQMRLSCTKQEQTIMRRLTTVQGQLFVLLKYLIKSKSCHARAAVAAAAAAGKTGSKEADYIITKGLKSFHAKTLLITILRKHYRHEVEEDHSSSCGAASEQQELADAKLLMQLLLEAFNLLLQHLKNDASSRIPQVLTHSLLADAGLYLKVPGPQPDATPEAKQQAEADPKNHRELMGKISWDIQLLLDNGCWQLQQILREYESRLLQVEDNGFLFAPLLLLPRINADEAVLLLQGEQQQEEEEMFELQEEDEKRLRAARTISRAYTCVWQVLRCLQSSESGQFSPEADSAITWLLQHSCTATAACCLSAMRSIRQGRGQQEIEQILRAAPAAVARRIRFLDSSSSSSREQQLLDFVHRENCLWAFHYFAPVSEKLDFRFVTKKLRKAPRLPPEARISERKFHEMQLHEPILIPQSENCQPSITINFDCLHCLLWQTYCNDEQPMLEYMLHAADCLYDPRFPTESEGGRSRCSVA